MTVQKSSYISKIGLGIIKFFRRLFLNTPANNWKVTGVIREWIYRNSVKSEEIEIDYMGVKIAAPSHDLGLVPGLVGGYYEKYQLEVFKKLSQQASSIIDVGSNIGLYTVIGAKNMKKGGTIIAFEPIADNINLLKKNIKLNKLVSKIRIEQSAVGDESKKLKLFVSTKSVGNHSASKENAGGASTEVEVNQTSLDDYVKNKKISKIDLIKIDVEGFDGYVLKGAKKTITKYQPAMVIESIPKLIKNCDFKYEEFSKLLFNFYKKCYSIDEVSGKITPIKKTTIKKFSKDISNTNLVLVSKPSHIKLIEELVIKGL